MKSLKATLNTPPEPGFDDASLADSSLPDDGSIVRHPDGYYWIAADGHQEFGPFDTVQEALADMNAGDEEAPEPVRNVYNNIDQDRVLAVAGGVAFFALLAIFPAVTTLVSLYGVITDRAHVAEDLASLSSFLPDGAVSIISEQAIRIASGAPLSLGFAALFSFALATWSANSGMKALMDALNVSYGKRETRTFLRVNMTSFALSLGALVFLVLMLSAVAAVPVILEFLWLDRWSQWLIWAGRWPAILILLGLAISVLYRWGPNIKNTSWRWYSPGSVLASVGLLGFSMLFSWYAANLAAFNETYGSLGAVMAFLAWMWLSTVVVLTGAELNAELDRRLGDRPTLTAPR